MSWTLQYRRAFSAIGDQQTVDSMKSYLWDPEFGIDAAHVLKSVWRKTQPKEDKSGFFTPWPDFVVVPEECPQIVVLVVFQCFVVALSVLFGPPPHSPSQQV